MKLMKQVTAFVGQVPEKFTQRKLPKIPLVIAALLVGSLGAYFILASHAATGCTTTLSVNASINNALSSASPGSVVCLSAGNWSAQTLSSVAPSGMVTLQPAPGATVHIAGITLKSSNTTKNLTIQGLYVGSGGIQSLCAMSNVVFQYNTIQNIQAGNAFYFYGGSCGNDAAKQTNISMLNNQMDHVGDCVTVAGGDSMEQNFTFKNNVCGPNIGYGVTTGNQYSHYVEIGCIGGGTFDNNAFLGPYDATALSNTNVSTAVHNNVFHCFGDGSNVSFSNNIIWHAQSRAQTVLIQSGKMDNITLHNNLFVNDPFCHSDASNCPAQDIEIYPTHGLTVTNNTIATTAWGLHFPSVCNDGCYASGQNGNISNNVVESAGIDGNNDYSDTSGCGSGCVTGNNVSYDSSAPGSPNVKNWAPSYTSTSWTPPNGEPYTAPPNGYYVAKGLPFTAGWDGAGGPPNGGVGAIAFLSGNGGGGSSDTTAPTVSLSAPSGGSTVSGSVTVSANASDNVGVTSVQFKLDGNNLGSADSSSPYSTSWDTTGTSNGTHTLTAIATDAAGNSATAANVSVTVNNTTGGSGGSSACTVTLSNGANLANTLSSAAGGAVICLNNGTYGASLSQVNKASIVTVQPAPGQTANIDYSLLNKATNIRFKNLHFIGGVEVLGPSSFIQFVNDEFTGEFGIHIDGQQASGGSEVTDVLIDGNYIHDLDFTGDEGTAKGNGIKATNGIEHLTISNNIIKSTAEDYINIADPTNLTIDHNTFLGPSLREPNHSAVHQDLVQVFGGGANVTFTNNVAHDTGTNESLMFQDATLQNVRIENNLFDRDSDGYTCQVYQSIGLTLKSNTVLGTWGCLVRDAASRSGGSNYQVDHNIFANSVAGHTGLAVEGRAASWGTYDYNVSDDGSVAGSHSIQNWNPSWQNTAWSPTAQQSATPTGYYQPPASNLPFAAGYQGSIGAPSFRSTSSGGGGTTDTTAPTVSFASPANNATVSGTVTATANASDDTGVTKVEISLDGTLKMTDTQSPYNYSFDSKTLSNGAHTLSAKAYDAAGNTKTATITINVNNPDTTPPSTPSNLSATAQDATTVKLSWTASTDTGTGATGVAKYNVLRNGVVIAQPTTTSYTDSSAAANTSYNYVVQAVDGAGNVSSSSNTATVKTPTAPDTTAPTLPASLSGTAVSINQINLSWNASTDTGGSGLAGYNIYRGGTKINSSLVTTTSYGDSTVSPDTTYSYQVEAVDGAGNKSAKTTAISVKTPKQIKGDVAGPAGAPDGKINLTDVSYEIRHYNTTDTTGDVSGPNGVPDGKVDIYDLSYIIRNYGN